MKDSGRQALLARCRVLWRQIIKMIIAKDQVHVNWPEGHIKQERLADLDNVLADLDANLEQIEASMEIELDAG